MFQSKYLTVILMILVAAGSRLLPHPPNFSPILAISLFAGAYLPGKRLAYLIPVLAMFLSDLVIGFHELVPLVYLCMVLFVFLGATLSKKINLPRTVTFTLGSSVFFFVTTNFAVWLTSGLYSLNVSGLIQCFTMAIPFFQNSLLGDFVFVGILFGSMAFLETSYFSKRATVLAK
jgi:hypothetical protein